MMRSSAQLLEHTLLISPSLPSAGAQLGCLPAPSALAGVPLIPSSNAPPDLTLPTYPLVSMTAPQASAPPAAPQVTQPVVISPALPPIPGKLVAKITSGAFVEMRELLPDNLTLRRTMEIQDEFSATPQTIKPPLREVQSLTSWVCCMATYFAVLAAAGELRPDHLAYLRLIVHEATKYKGDGWRAYDATFRQNMAAGAPGLEWSRIDAGLHAISFQSMRAPTPLVCCPLCLEPDHTAQDCALQSASSSSVVRTLRERPGLQAHRHARAGGTRTGFNASPYSRPPPLCHSWNAGACSREPGACRYDHICAKCIKTGNRRSHKAVDCKAPTSGRENSTGRAAAHQGTPSSRQ